MPRGTRPDALRAMGRAGRGLMRARTAPYREDGDGEAGGPLARDRAPASHSTPRPNGPHIRSQASYYPVSEEHPIERAASVLALGATRRYLRESHARMMVVFFALLYALGSMVLGGMLLLARVPGGYTSEVLWGNAYGSGSWNYPGLLVVAPWGVLSFPFLATLSMALVSIGVGIGVTVAILISVKLVRDRRTGAARAGSVGSIAGLTPAMIALVTLGACCSTTAAATAGVGLVAQASGSTLNNLLVNNWFLDVFQVSILYVALVAQELILRVYGGLFGLTVVAPPGTTARGRAQTLGVGALRAALLLAGLTWSLAMLAEWAGASPPLGSGPLWFQWVFQHQLLGDFAVLVALVPAGTARFFSRIARPMNLGLRAALLVAGVSLAAWTPAVVAAGGAPGFLNELFAVAGLPASWGAVAPVFAPGVALFSRWAFQYLLVGGFAIAVAVRPRRVLSAVSGLPTDRMLPPQDPQLPAWDDPGRASAGAANVSASVQSASVARQP
jgi:hypothetical protein